ncbi:MAG: acetolactate decarboxylase [Thermoguttaceae bacterium]|nr:acetolactate decarboxylase [Thermoguttaceae bacterium]
MRFSFLTRFFPAILLLGFLAPAPSVRAISPADPKVVQISTVGALLAGEYDGVVSVRQLLGFGNFGIGTVNAIDGELIVFRGVPFVAKADGSVRIAPNNETVPFAAVVNLDWEKVKWTVFDKPVGRAGFTAAVDAIATNPNYFYAIYFEGKFSGVEARSERGQTKPYRPLAETMKTAEVRYSIGGGEGVMFGFRSPEFVSGLNVPGDHLHFLTYDHTKGGHVTDFTIESGVLGVQPIPAFTVYMPEKLNALPGEISRDRTEELNEIEKR